MNILTYPMNAKYCSNWGLWEAIRELVANTKDAGGDVIMKEDRILFQTETHLENRHLILGVSEKPDSAIGRFGEGLKLALMILCREKVGVDVVTGDGHRWTMRMVDKFGEQVFQVRITEAEGPCCITVYMPWKAEWSDHLYDGPFGKVSGKARLYVNGIHICSLPEFRYAWNLPANLVRLNRDRMIPDLWSVRAAVFPYIRGEIAPLIKGGFGEISQYQVPEAAVRGAFADVVNWSGVPQWTLNMLKPKLSIQEWWERWGSGLGEEAMKELQHATGTSW